MDNVSHDWLIGSLGLLLVHLNDSRNRCIDSLYMFALWSTQWNGETVYSGQLIFMDRKCHILKKRTVRPTAILYLL